MEKRHSPFVKVAAKIIKKVAKVVCKEYPLAVKGECYEWIKKNKPPFWSKRVEIDFQLDEFFEDNNLKEYKRKMLAFAKNDIDMYKAYNTYITRITES